jgi:DNA polymerase-3 subunit epsilon
VKQAIEPFEFHRQNFLIIDNGRDDNEKAVVGIENGKYLGFGFFDMQSGIAKSAEDLKAFIKPYSDNRDVQQIIRSYLKRKKAERIIEM